MTGKPKNATVDIVLNSDGSLSVTDTVTVDKGGKVTFNVSWPTGSTYPTSGTCTLTFKDNTQDTFTGVNNDTTSFDVDNGGSQSYNVAAATNIGTDDYDVSLNLAGTAYSTDPQIVVDKDPN